MDNKKNYIIGSIGFLIGIPIVTYLGKKLFVRKKQIVKTDYEAENKNLYKIIDDLYNTLGNKKDITEKLLQENLQLKMDLEEKDKELNQIPDNTLLKSYLLATMR